MTAVAMAVTKGLGVIRIAQLLHVGPREALPWNRLLRITALSGIAAVPVVWLQHHVAWHPLITFLAAGALYVSTYALLSFGPTLRARLQPALVFSAPRSVRLQADQE